MIMIPYKVGLVLGSGASRGWAHIGVIEALQDAGIPIHLVAEKRGSGLHLTLDGYFKNPN